MGYYRRRTVIIVFSLIYFFAAYVYANSNDFYNSLVEDLENSCSYGYKGINLETGKIDFTNYTGPDGYIVTASDTDFYIQSNMGFFKVKNNTGEVFYTRNGEFVKRGNEYYLVSGNYKLETAVESCSGDSNNKRTLIFHPTEDSKIVRHGFLFTFTEVKSVEEEIIPNRLELPNTDSIMILLKMKSFLSGELTKYSTQLEIVDRMLDVLISDKMHEYYIRRSYCQFDLEKYRLVNEQTNLEQLQFIYCTNWARTFRKYIKKLYLN
jgi:flagellar hook protein FlgE